MAIYVNNVQKKGLHVGGTKISKAYVNGVQVYSAFDPVTLSLSLNGSNTGFTTKSGDSSLTRKGYSAVQTPFGGGTADASGSSYSYTLKVPLYAYKSSWGGITEKYTIRAYIGNAPGAQTIYLGSATKTATSNTNFTQTFTATGCTDWLGGGNIYLTLYYTTDEAAQSRLYIQQNVNLTLVCNNVE